MKKLTLMLFVTFAPAAALAWAPYEQQSFDTQMQNVQVDYSAAAVSVEYDPAMVPLAYVEENYEAEPTVNTEGPLDAD